MKKSRIAKLALLGASTAALAATLSTSTYAWYVSSKTAKVNTTYGSSASAGADQSITLSVNGQYGTFFNEISLGSYSAAQLTPVVTADGKNFYKLNDANGVATPSVAATCGILGDGKSETGSNSVYKYVFYIKADANLTVKPLITIRNTTETYHSQVNFTGVNETYTVSDVQTGESVEGLYTKDGDNYVAATGVAVANTVYYTRTAGDNKVQGVSAGQEFYVNALNAMSLSCWTTESSTAISKDAKNGTYDADDSELAGFQSLSNNLDGTYVKTSTTVNTPTPQALSGAQDYFEVIGKTTLEDYELDSTTTISATDSFTSATGFGTIDLSAGKPTKLEYYLWIDGASDVCFNACENQAFSVTFDFTVASN